MPARPVFDYDVTYGAPPSLTADGALDGIAHSLEVLLWRGRQALLCKRSRRGPRSIRLVVNYLPRADREPRGRGGRGRRWAWRPTWAATRSCSGAPMAGT